MLKPLVALDQLPDVTPSQIAERIVGQVENLQAGVVGCPFCNRLGPLRPNLLEHKTPGNPLVVR